MNYYKSAIRKVHTALSLSPGEWRLFMQAWFGLLMADLLLRSRPFPRVQQIADKKMGIGHPVSPDLAWEIIRHHQRLVLLAVRYHIYPMSCLRQALTLKKLLNAQGLPTQLRFGVRKAPQQLLAHAWLEYEGCSIEFSHPNKETFAPLTSKEDKP